MHAIYNEPNKTELGIKIILLKKIIQKNRNCKIIKNRITYITKNLRNVKAFQDRATVIFYLTSRRSQVPKAAKSNFADSCTIVINVAKLPQQNRGYNISKKPNTFRN